MPKSNQKLHWIKVDRLKNLNGLAELALDESPLVALTGANGAGKSTVLHALACSFKPLHGQARLDYKFPNFFLPTTDSRWQGSTFEICHSYRDGQEVFGNTRQTYAKAEDRWTPRYQNRPERHLEYIGVSSCVPRIEEERATTFLELHTVAQGDDLSRQIREAASRILNRDYTQISRKNNARGRSYRGAVFNGLAYSSLSMGAGEQRVFEILERLYAAPRSSLFLIDEIDLLMHEDALKKLIVEIHERASEKNIQIIFTTHRESILLLAEKVKVHHIYNSGAKTLSLPGAHPDVWHRLTGQAKRPIEVFVEDTLAAAVVAKEAELLQIRRYVEISIVGAASNIITVACGFALRDELSPSTAFFLDGDVFLGTEAKEECIRRVLTGDDRNAIERRARVLQHIHEFTLPAGYCPERLIHELLIALDRQQNLDNLEIINAAHEIGVPAERHGFVNEIVRSLGHTKDIGISKVIDAAAKSDRWEVLTANLRQWLIAQKGRHNL